MVAPTASGTAADRGVARRPAGVMAQRMATVMIETAATSALRNQWTARREACRWRAFSQTSGRKGPRRAAPSAWRPTTDRAASACNADASSRASGLRASAGAFARPISVALVMVAILHRGRGCRVNAAARDVPFVRE